MHPVEQLYHEVRDHKINMMSRIMGGDYHAGEDIVQEAFLLAWKFFPSYDEDRGSMNTWFNGILYNSLRMYQREKRGDPISKSKEISPEDVLSNNEYDPVLLRQSIKLVDNDRHRRVLELFFVLGYNSREISMIENKMTQSNVTTIVNRFKEGMKDA